MQRRQIAHHHRMRRAGRNVGRDESQQALLAVGLDGKILRIAHVRLGVNRHMKMMPVTFDVRHGVLDCTVTVAAPRGFDAQLPGDASIQLLFGDFLAGSGFPATAKKCQRTCRQFQLRHAGGLHVLQGLPKERRETENAHGQAFCGERLQGRDDAEHIELMAVAVTA
ncbi:hypothetical protein D3C81_1187830 [compost metagenome]